MGRQGADCVSNMLHFRHSRFKTKTRLIKLNGLLVDWGWQAGRPGSYNAWKLKSLGSRRSAVFLVDLEANGILGTSISLWFLEVPIENGGCGSGIDRIDFTFEIYLPPNSAIASAIMFSLTPRRFKPSTNLAMSGPPSSRSRSTRNPWPIYARIKGW